MATYSGFIVTGVKHVRRRGPNVAPVADAAAADESHFLASAIHDTDQSPIGMSVTAFPAMEALPPVVLTALHAAFQAWVDTYPDGDPGDFTVYS
jgi:hypothetical protein